MIGVVSKDGGDPVNGDGDWEYWTIGAAGAVDGACWPDV